MALIKCKECLEEVSSTALNCPKCGFQLNKPKRSFIGKVFKWIFILFNLLMLVWLIGGWSAASEVGRTATSAAEQAGAAIGAGIGITMILGLWVIGDIILGLPVLLTRPKR